jgi:hypothetical protein
MTTFSNTTQTFVTSLLLLSLTHNVQGAIETQTENFTLTETEHPNMDEITTWNPLSADSESMRSQSPLTQIPQWFLMDEYEDLDYQTVAMTGRLGNIAERYHHAIVQNDLWEPLPDVDDLLETSKFSTSGLLTEDWQWTQKSIIHPTLPQFLFKLVGTQKRSSDEVNIKTIEIQRDNESQPMQIIETSAIPMITDDYVAFKIEDLNFDGYKDISLMRFTALVNAQYIYWLFDPKKGTFVHNEQFSQMITSPWEIDPENHFILSYWQWNAVHQGTNYYKIIDNQPVLVRQEEEIFLSEDVIKVRVHERVGDEMKIISETIQPYLEEE